MQPDASIEVWKLVVSAVSGGLFVKFVEWGWAWWSAPQLLLSFGNGAPYFSRSPISIQIGDSAKHYPDGIWVRFGVENLGRAPAKNVQAFIVGLKKIDSDGSVHRFEDHDSISLVWAPQELKKFTIDLPRNAKFFVDLGFTVERDAKKFLPASRLMPHAIREAWKTPGRFDVQVLVVADNHKGVGAWISFHWSGAWNDFQAIKNGRFSAVG